MKNVYATAMCCIMVFAGFSVHGDEVNGSASKVLYVYDEVTERGSVYNDFYRTAFRENGIDFDEMTPDKPLATSLDSYDTIFIHGMVMAFNGKSPVRDWLKSGVNVKGKKVFLMVTANRWFLKDLYKDIATLLQNGDADVVDAVSMATKKMSTEEKYATVRNHIQRLN